MKFFNVLTFVFFIFNTAGSQELIWYDDFLSNVWINEEGQNPREITSQGLVEVITGMSVHHNSEKIYLSLRPFFGDGQNQIARMNLDGSNFEKILDLSQETEANYLTVSNKTNRIFWIELNDSNFDAYIISADLEGDNIDTIFTYDRALLTDLTINEQSNEVLWVLQNEEIWKTNFQGNDPVKLTEVRSSKIQDLSTFGDFVFYTVKKSTFGNDVSSLSRINLDGTQDSTLIDLGTASPLGTAIDTFNQKVYWTQEDNGEQIFSADFDGTNQQLVFTAEDIIREEDVAEITDVDFSYKQLSSIQEPLKTDVRIYPNPSPGSIFIDSSIDLLGKEKIIVRVFDVNGHLVFNRRMHTQGGSIYLDVPNGNYIVEISDANQTVVSKKLQIIK